MNILAIIIAVCLLCLNKFVYAWDPFLKIYSFIMLVFLPCLLIYLSVKDDVARLVRKLRTKKHTWEVIEVSPKRVKRRKRKKVVYAPSWMSSTGKAGRGVLKELGIGYEKVKKEKPKKKRIVLSYRAREDKTEEMLRAKWQPYIEVLEERGEVHVGKNHHYGKLRGKDILRAMYRDLRRLGYNVELELDDYDGVIKLKR